MTRGWTAWSSTAGRARRAATARARARDARGPGALLRRLRALADDGLVELTWTLLAAATGRGTSAGCGPRRTARRPPRSSGTGSASPGRPLGPRQVAALARARRRTRPPGDGVGRRAPAGAGHGRRRPGRAPRRAPRRVRDRRAGPAGPVRAEVRERPRRPLAGRPVGVRGARPAGSGLTGAQDAALRSCWTRSSVAIRRPPCSTA